jgi:hypothetical protein
MEPPQIQRHTQLRHERASGGKEREQTAGCPHYGAAGPPSVAHGRARHAGGQGSLRFGPSHSGNRAERLIGRLSGVPEGDEMNEGGGMGRGGALAVVPPRMYFSLIVWAVMAPLLVLGPHLGQFALEVPKSLPAHQWQWTDDRVHVPPHVVKGAHLAQVSQAGIAKLNSMAVSVDPAGVRGDNLLRTLSSQPRTSDGMVGGSLGPNQVGVQRSPYGTEIVRVGHHSIWNWGPFIFTVGVMVSILAKLLIAMPSSKMGTDLLLMWAGTQQSTETPEGYYGYVYLERDEEFGGPSPQRIKAGEGPRTPKGAASSTAASQAVTPRHSIGDTGSRPVSCDSKRSTPGRKKWPVTLDLPEGGGVSLCSSLPQPAQAKNLQPTPLPTVSPESALTSPGETLLSDLEVTPGV